MNDIVWLDVGGTIFKTTKATLNSAPYFESMNNFQDLTMTTSDNPIFIDRDPELFRHVLNLLRDPDYKYPESYFSELTFYGIHSRIPTRDVDQSCNNNELIFHPEITSKSCPYLTDNPQITFHQEVCRRHTPILMACETHTAKNLPATFKFIGEYCIYDIFIIIPDSIPIEEVKFFNITVIIGSKKFHWNLLVEYLNDNIISEHGYHSIRIDKILRPSIPLIAIQKGVTITLETIKPEYKNLRAIIKFSKSYLGETELKRFQTQNQRYIIRSYSMAFVSKNKYHLPAHEIRNIIWYTDQPVNVEFISPTNQSYIMTPVDYGLIERQRCNKKPLPANTGSIYFCNDAKNDQPSGSLYGEEWTMLFHPAVNVGMWICCYDVLNISNGKVKIEDKTFDPRVI